MIIRHINSLSIFTFTLLLFSFQIHAQQLQCSADIMSSAGAGLINLTGNVVLQQGNVTIYCDRALFNKKENSFDGGGNIRIKQGESTTYGDLLTFDGNKKIGHLRRNVRLIDNAMTLTTQFLDFNTAENSGYFYNGGTIIDSSATLTSKTGYYYSKTHTYFFKQDVVVKNDKYTLTTDTLKFDANKKIAYVFGPTQVVGDSSAMYLEDGWYNTEKNISQINKKGFIKKKNQIIKADNLYYDRNLGVGRAKNNVEIIDVSENVTLKGNEASYTDKPFSAFITNRAVLQQITDGDTLFLHADTLYSTLDSSGKFKCYAAYRKVQFYKSDLQARCDSLYFSMFDTIVQMYHEPVLWSSENQITADRIEIYTHEFKANKLKLYNSSFIITKEDTSRFNQINGRDMVAYIRDNQLYRIDVLGSCKTIYFPKDKLQYIGINKAECSKIVIHIKDRKIERINFTESPNATLFPIDALNRNDMIIKGFKWLGNFRPLKMEDIFVWK